MATPNSETQLRKRLSSEVVAPLFTTLKPRTDGSIPSIVLLNRQTRARERVLDALVSRGSVSSAALKRAIRRLAKRWARQGFADEFSEISEFEIRCARDRELVDARASGDPNKLQALLESRYRDQVVQRFGFVELRGLQLSARVRLELEQLFVPLHLELLLENLHDDAGFACVLADRTPTLERLAEHRCLLIVGTPGSGKTTLLSHLATIAAKGELFFSGISDPVLPMVVTVRELGRAKLTLAGIAHTTGVDTQVVRKALEDGRGLVLVDGLDEAPADLREALDRQLVSFARKYRDVKMVVTTRPAGSLSKIADSFFSCQLGELTGGEVETFIDNWCLGAELSVTPSPHEAKRLAVIAANDLNQRIARSPPVQRIAVNPLLCTILCVVHRFLGHAIPEQRVTLYEKCTDALLYEWDAAKFAADSAIGKLDARGKRRLLMQTASALHKQHVVEIPESEVLDHFRATLPDLGLQPGDARKVLDEIRDRSGLLVERRPGYFAFSHRTFQEYLTALDVVRTRKYRVMLDHYENPWWHEVIVLAAGVEHSDAGHIARGLLEKKSTTATLLAAQCLDTEIDMPRDIRARVENGVTQLIPPRTFEEAAKIGRLGAVAAPILMEVLQNTAIETFAKDGKYFYALGALVISRYEPAVPLFAKIVASSSGYTRILSAVALIALAMRSDTSRIALAKALEVIPKETIERLQSLLTGQGKQADPVRALFHKKLASKARETTARPRPKKARAAQ